MVLILRIQGEIRHDLCAGEVYGPVIVKVLLGEHTLLAHEQQWGIQGLVRVEDLGGAKKYLRPVI